MLPILLRIPVIIFSFLFFLFVSCWFRAVDEADLSAFERMLQQLVFHTRCHCSRGSATNRQLDWTHQRRGANRHAESDTTPCIKLSSIDLQLIKSTSTRRRLRSEARRSHKHAYPRSGLTHARRDRRKSLSRCCQHATH